MFKEIIGKIKTKINERNQSIEEYHKLLSTSQVINGLLTLPTEINPNNKIDPADIVNNCPDLNDTKAKLIINTIPIDELPLVVIYTKEIKSNKEYYFVPTTRFLWIINQYGYLKYEYSNVTMRIIKSGLMSKSVYFNNHMMEMNGDKVDYLSNLINNKELRNQEIINKLATLCGVNPKLRIINNIGTGISVDNQRNIVFHTKDLNSLDGRTLAAPFRRFDLLITYINNVEWWHKACKEVKKNKLTANRK